MTSSWECLAADVMLSQAVSASLLDGTRDVSSTCTLLMWENCVLLSFPVLDSTKRFLVIATEDAHPARMLLCT